VKPPDQTIPGQEIVALRAYLIANGCTPAEAGRAIAGMAGKTRKQAGEQMAAWSHSLTKGKVK
jgi:hypothetical protein